VRDPKTFEPERSRNVTALDLEIDEVSVKVSLLWFLQGKGWLRELNATGVKGSIDQRHLDWSGSTAAPRRTWQRGDLFLDNMTLTNVEISLFKPKPDREMKISLHLLDCPKLRKQFLLYDILQARSAYGIFDGSLFSLKQSYSDDDRIRVRG
jgi:mitochondrial distribution and morphology protein 31